jgi:hypothetical protein
MLSFDTTALTIYLVVAFVLAAIALVLSLGVVATEVAHNRRIRLARHQSMRTYYGRLALHH